MRISSTEVNYDWTARRHRKKWEQYLRAARHGLLRMLMAMIPPIISVAIIGSLSRFQKNRSTFFQRFMFMSWLAFGGFYGSAASMRRDWIVHNRLAKMDQSIREKVADHARNLPYTILVVIVFAIFAVPPVWSFVLVEQMILEYGVCELIT
jgi:hypothetical protein